MTALHASSLTCAAEFLADHPAQRRFKRLATASHEISQSLIDKTLIVAATRLIHLVSKPLEDILIKPNGDTRLTLWNRHDGASLALAEVVFLPHEFS
jgi:hypothetical protein